MSALRFTVTVPTEDGPDTRRCATALDAVRAAFGLLDDSGASFATITNEHGEMVVVGADGSRLATVYGGLSDLEWTPPAPAPWRRVNRRPGHLSLVGAS